MPRSLLSLPVEVLCLMLSLLNFDDIVSISGVCSNLRRLALAECQLWQNLPVVNVSQLGAVSPFVSRAGKLGADLSIVNIEVIEFACLGSMLRPLFPQLRLLRLDFSQTDMEDCDELVELWLVLSQTAPLLETLELTSNTRGEFMQDVPSFAFAGDIFPKLRRLEITAFSLDAVCSAFRYVTDVTTTIAAVAPRSQPTLLTNTEPEWSNFRIHDHFPSIRSLQLSGIEHEDDDDFANVLTSVPFIDKPLDQLLLEWRPQSVSQAPLNDPAFKWLEESLKYVHITIIIHLQWRQIRDAVFASLTCGGRISLRIKHHSHMGSSIRMIVTSEDLDIARAAIFPEEDLCSHIDKLLTLPHVTISGVWISSDLKDLQSLDPLWQSLRNATLGVIISGAFVEADGYPIIAGVSTLCFEAGPGTFLDMLEVRMFAERVVPNVTTISVSQAASVINASALPPSVQLVYRT